MFEQLESRCFLSAVLLGIDLTIKGTGGDDQIQVTQGGTFLTVHENGQLTFFGDAQDRIFQMFIKTFGGNDRIRVDVNINTTVWAGAGDDLISGGAANDILKGGRGNDTLLGNDGDDFLIGRAGRDVLKGGIGNDILDGFDGHRDKLLGGGGEDTALVDKRVDFGRGNENILRIEPGFAFSPDYQGGGDVAAGGGSGLFIEDKTLYHATYDAMFGSGGFNALFKFANITGKVPFFNDSGSEAETSAGTGET